MANIPERWDGSNQWYFITVVTKNRTPLFVDKTTCNFLLESFHKVHKHNPFRLGALTILPDHWHGLICPSEHVVIEQVVGAVKKNVWNNFTPRSKTIWQSRFLDHRIRDYEDYVLHAEYIRLNSVKHLQYGEPDKYPWCKIHPNPFEK